MTTYRILHRVQPAAFWAYDDVEAVTMSEAAAKSSARAEEVYGIDARIEFWDVSCGEHLAQPPTGAVRVPPARAVDDAA